MPETEVVEESQEVQEEVEEKAVETPEEVQDDNASQRWGEVVPELKDEYSKLDVGTRENILLNRLQAQAQEAAAKADIHTDAATTHQNSKPPVVPEVSLPGAEAIQDAVQKAIDEGDSKALSAILTNQNDCMQSAFKSFLEVLSGQDGRINDIVLPNQFLAVMGNVPGATDSDVREAIKLFRKGGISDETAALKVAVFNRQTEVTSSQPRRTVNDEARRKAAALAASDMSNSSSPSGGVRERMPETPEETKAFMEREQKER